jgi:MinD superfamily P-loop ATPase
MSFRKRMENNKPRGKPDDILQGICGTCKKTVEVPRFQAKVKKEHWGEVPAVECPQCRACVYLTVKPPMIPVDYSDYG